MPTMKCNGTKQNLKWSESIEWNEDWPAGRYTDATVRVHEKCSKYGLGNIHLFFEILELV
jgi:hypothetical protein